MCGIVARLLYEEKNQIELFDNMHQVKGEKELVSASCVLVFTVWFFFIKTSTIGSILSTLERETTKPQNIDRRGVLLN